MATLCVILARAGSKGLPGKNKLELCGRPMIAWTLAQARAARRLDRIAVSTDDADILALCRREGAEVVERPAELAGDTATVDAAARHAVEALERRDGRRYDHVVILYGNVPVRPASLVDDAVEKLLAAGCDSVQSVCPVGKMHPYWMKTLGGPAGDALLPYVENAVYRRQDLPAVFMLDGGIIAVTRRSLFVVEAGRPHAFLGTDRRAIVTSPGEVVDVDSAHDLVAAEAALAGREGGPGPGAERRDGRPRPLDLPGARGTTYVIAELGVNHDGSPARALELTRAAADCGANAVKLQLFDPRHLLSAEAELAGYQRGAAGDAFAMLARLQLAVEDMLAVKALASELGLGFVVTPFSLESLADMRRLDPDAVKIASPDCVNRPLIQAMMTLGKPMLVSTGAAEAAELESMLPLLRRCRPLVLMACVSSYPTPDDQAMLGRIGQVLACGELAGYSDHTTNIHTGGLAVAAGARIVEKHLTHDQAAPGPDHAASFDPPRFRQYVEFIRLAGRMRPPGPPAVLPCELDVRRVSRQSVCAVHDLPAGHVLQPGDLTVKRPGTGIPAAQLQACVGQRLSRAVRANHLLREGDVSL